MEKLYEKFTASLHTHVRSEFDAHITPQRLCERIVAMNGKGCAITDHGVLSSIEDYRRVFDSYGLKCIPGVELYVDGGILGRLHLILLAKNDLGYKGICKIVTESNRNIQDGFPITTKENLEKYMAEYKEYKGNIFAFSACMQGVISAIFLLNNVVERKIAKVQKKQEKYLSPADNKVVVTLEKLEKAKIATKEAIEKRDATKRLAEMKFANREKSVAKLEANNDPKAVESRIALEKDKKAAETAKKNLEDAKKAVETAKKEEREANIANNKMTEEVNKYLELEEEIENLKKELKTDDEIWFLAIKEAEYYKELFGKNHFLAEIQYHGIPEEKICYPQVVKVAKEIGLPLIATNDVHILDNSDGERLKRQILRSLRFGTEFKEEQVGDNELYLKNNEELFNSISEIIPEEDVIKAINNIDVVFNACNVEFKTEKHYPKCISSGKSSEEILDEKIQEGIKKRFSNGLPKEYQERLDYEIGIIKSMGYTDYHLVVCEFLEYAEILGHVPKKKIAEAPLDTKELLNWIKENGWKNPGFRRGPGRGSAVGSLVCYLLGITALDPIKYGLLFERFLNPERVSMPDIDSDISNTTRAKVIEHIQYIYGKDAVCGIMTTNAQAPKGCLRIAAKFYGLKMYKEAMTSLGDQIAKDVPKDVGTSFETTVNANGAVDSEAQTSLLQYLLEKYKDNKDAVEVIKWAKVCEGLFTAYGMHAAGIAISDNEDISDYIPLKWNSSARIMTSQCDMAQLEENGLLKFDLLGLQTLDIITEAMFMIEKNTGVIINPLTLDVNDPKVYKEILSIGRTNSVFQFESSGMKTMLKRFKPACFEDLIILVSMFRPGPLQYLDGVIDVKNGRKPMTFLTPELEAIVGKTYGAIVYQEQVMEICQQLAGFTLGHADEVRRYMSKKKKDKLAHEEEVFISGCENKGISKEIATELFNQMMDFARYAFNKSHAAAYAYNAFITAWLKCYYPAEFFAAALNWAADNNDISGLVYEATECGVKVLPPNVNKSEKDFSARNNEIRFGLSAVQGVKDHANEIINERYNGSYKNLADFIIRVMPNSTVYTNLIKAGALDDFGKNRVALENAASKYIEVGKIIEVKRSFITSAKVVMPKINLSAEEIIKYQKDAGVKVEIKEPTTIEKLEKRIATAENTLQNLEEELNNIRIINCPEDKTLRMNEEKKFLGMYITEHPMDYYPEPKEIESVPVIEMDSESTTCYGVISDLKIKKKKADGKEMAFFNIEDKSGSIEVACFTKAYAQFKNLINEGNVIRLVGIYELPKEENDKPKFIMNGGKLIEKKKVKLLIPVHSAETFMKTIDTFKENFMDNNGMDCYIVDMTTRKISVNPLPFKVTERVKFFMDAQETYKI